MTGGPAVSVALASYNGERFIERQLDSIGAQSLPAREIVVSDGGSRDRTVEIVTGWMAAHPEANGRLIADGARLGVTRNFERAIAATNSDFIALSDQDDLWAVDRLRLEVEAFADESILFVNSDARLVGVEGEPLGLSLFEALGVGAVELVELAGSAAFPLLLRRNLVTGATGMIRRVLADRAMPFPEGWVHDEWLAIIAAATGRLRPLHEELIDYRQHGANQIGVAAPTLRHRIGRMVEPRDGRYVRLAARARELATRLEDLGADPQWRELAQRKRIFEESRARYGRSRVSRIIPVLRNAAGGAYSALSSQGRLDIVRDLVQPS